jgi:hypothetical protein
MNLRSYARLTFDTKQNGSVVLSSPNADIFSVTTRKDLAATMGNFTIILGPRIAKQLLAQKGTILVSDIIQTFDLVQIEFKTEAGYKTEMMGVVSRAAVSLVIDKKTGRPTRGIKIDGFDFGKLLQSFKLYFNPFYVPTPSSSPQQNLQVLGGAFFFGNTNIFNNNNPAEFISNFLAYCFTHNASITGGPIYPLQLGASKRSIQKYVDFVTGVSTPFKQHTMTDPTILTSLQSGAEVTVGDIVKAYSDPPFHETFVDLRRTPGSENTHKLKPLPSDELTTPDTVNTKTPSYQQPYVFNMRVSPFSSADYAELNQHFFTTSDVVQQDTATSEDNIFNYYEVLCERENFVMGTTQIGALMANTLRRVPIFDKQSIDTFGFRRFPQNATKYVEFVQNTDIQNLNILKKQAFLARLLLEWYAYGENFETGTISLKGRVGIDEGGITMGSRLIERTPSGNRTGKEFYIESVVQEWAFGDTLQTTVAVTRGHVPVDSYYSNGVLLPGRFNQVTALEESLNLKGPGNDIYFEDISA